MQDSQKFCKKENLNQDDQVSIGNFKENLINSSNFATMYFDLPITSISAELYALGVYFFL